MSEVTSNTRETSAALLLGERVALVVAVLVLLLSVYWLYFGGALEVKSWETRSGSLLESHNTFNPTSAFLALSVASLLTAISGLLVARHLPAKLIARVLFAVLVLGLSLGVYMRSRTAVETRTNEVAAIWTISTIHAAQTQYYSQFGRFASRLEDLGPPASGPAGPTGADLVSGDLAKGVRSGYQFIMAGGPAGYTISANPLTFGSTGRRTFFSDQSQVFRENRGTEPATVNSAEIK
jgi:hypothetical protein